MKNLENLNNLEKNKPFISKEKLPNFSLENIDQNLEKKAICRKLERNLVVENPEMVGINFDDTIDGRSFWSKEKYLQYILERDGEISDKIHSLANSVQGQEQLLEKKNKELIKEKEFYDYLSGFGNKLQHVRINPAGESSPISPSQAIERNSNGTFRVVIEPKFINQMKRIQEQLGKSQEQPSDLTLVVPFYNHRRGKEKSSDVPKTQEEVGQYTAVCKELISKLGDNISLELGNETNVSRSTAIMFKDKLQHANHVDSQEYGEFFFNVAKSIKEKYPTVKLSIAGVACFDPTYLRGVLSKVKKLETESGTEKLVNTISFHPYRDEPEKGSIEVKDGEFVGFRGLNYEDQMEEMQKIESEYKIKVNVGEINFPFSDSEQAMKLKKAIFQTTKKNIKSFIFPGTNVH